jgi:hypothetical protein
MVRGRFIYENRDEFPPYLYCGFMFAGVNQWWQKLLRGLFPHWHAGAFVVLTILAISLINSVLCR